MRPHVGGEGGGVRVAGGLELGLDGPIVHGAADRREVVLGVLGHGLGEPG